MKTNYGGNQNSPHIPPVSVANEDGLQDSHSNRHRTAWRVFGITTLAVFMVSLDATVVVAVFPSLRESFGATPDWLLSWILNAYTIVYAALLIPAGRWVDRWGHARAFSIGLTVFTGASALCGLSVGASFLIAARMLQAVGAALLTPAALALTLDAFPANRRPFVVGLWSACGALAAALGPGVGSWLVDLTSWTAIFWINVPVGLAGWWYAKRTLASSQFHLSQTSPDAFGSLILILGVGAVCAGIVRSSEASVLTTLTTLLCGTILLAALVIWVRKHPVASRDFSIFQNRNVLLANVATLVFGSAFGMMFLSFFLFMTGVWQFSQSLAGLAAMPGPLLVIPSAILSGRLATHFGQRPLLIAGGLLFAVSQIWYLLRVSAQPDYFVSWLPGQILAGLAIGMVLPNLTSQALAGLSSDHFGIGGAVNTALRQLGGAIGVAVAVAIVSHAGQTVSSFQVIYLILTVAGLLVAGIACGLKVFPQDPNGFEMAGPKTFSPPMRSTL